MSIVTTAAMRAAGVADLPHHRAGEPGPPYAVRDGKPGLTTSSVVGAVSVTSILGPQVRSWTRMLFAAGPVLVSGESTGAAAVAFPVQAGFLAVRAGGGQAGRCQRVGMPAAHGDRTAPHPDPCAGWQLPVGSATRR